MDVSDPVGGRDLSDGPVEVRFEGVRFAYREHVDVLRHVTVTVPAGARAAVVGETGSGKSTFVELMTRLLDPTAGRVLLWGVALTEVAFPSLRRRDLVRPPGRLPLRRLRGRQRSVRLTEGRTRVTVAHRLSTAEGADEVLVFDSGRLVERGPHEGLVGSGGVCARLHADWSSGAGG